VNTKKNKSTTYCPCKFNVTDSFVQGLGCAYQGR